MPFPFPGATDPLRPPLVDRALRSPGAATELGLDLLGGDLPDDLAPFVELPEAGAGATVDLLRERLAELDRIVRERIPSLPEPALLAGWPIGGVQAEHVKTARQVFDGLAGLDTRDLALRALAIAALARAIDPDSREWPETVERTETPLGAVVIGTRGDDEYTEEAWLLVDPGGNDVYRNRAGGVRMGPGTSLLVDLGGNDRYESEDFFSQGSAFGGVGVLVDVSGDDRYAGGDCSQGAAVVGVGLLCDGGGSDSFTADRYAQGAGTFGYGLLLVEGREDDRYRLGKQGQGYGRTAGYGVLRDRGGNDVYETGTKYESMYSQWTGGRKVYWSFAQGCGFGFYCRYDEKTPDGGSRLVTREMFPGGVGLLLDDEGDDAYRASMYGQGTAYFYGLGLCVDRAGNDSYTASWYGQGAAPHFAAGVLADGGGDDTYVGMHQVQGNGRDFSVGVLLDLAGDDAYTAEDRVQGCGDLRDGYGIFVDAAGKDRYDAKRESARGWATETNPERQPTKEHPYADVGVFLDLGGRDVYEGKAAGADGKTWVDARTKRGVGLDR